MVVAGCDIGPFAMVGAGAIVTKAVGSYALVAGNPARRLGWVCACGARLADSTGHAAPPDVERYARDPHLSCPDCGRRYIYVPDDESLRELPAAVVPQGARS